MKKRKRYRTPAILLALTMGILLLAGCAARNAEKEDAETIRVYLWAANLYEEYAPYVQSQLPDVNVEFVVGNNDLDFYKFLNENGGLPDIITCCRFSLHDARPLKNDLLDLSMTNAAGAVYNAYLSSFVNEDGSVNWLPVCADAHGFVVNRGLFERYDIPLPTDYDSFVAACRAFAEVGIRGYDADYYHDYTCMETLQGLSASELVSAAGRDWRAAYSDPAGTERVGLDKTVWPEAFERMERFIRDTGLTADDLNKNHEKIAELFTQEKIAMYFGSSSGVQLYRDQGMDTVFLPFFNENGEEWLMTTPYFQVALSRELEQDEARREKALRVLKVMLSEDAQNIVCDGQDTLSYSQNVPLRFTDALKEVRSVVEGNRMYIRIASNDFFAISKEVVSKMIAGEYDAEQAYQAFDALLRQPKESTGETVLTPNRSYSNFFHSAGGNEAYSVMANSLRSCYQGDVLIAACSSFTGNVLKADYTEKMVGNMIMPNNLLAYKRVMTGAELKETVRAFVEGCEGGFTPFNRGSLPVVSGISMDVREKNGAYTLVKLTKDGKPLQDEETLTVLCLATPKQMAPLLAEKSRVFEGGDTPVRETWVAYIGAGNTALAEPEHYITLR